MEIEKKMMKKKKMEVDDWFSYYGTGLELHEYLSVLLVRPNPFYSVLRYNIDKANAMPEPLYLPVSFPKDCIRVLGSWNGLVALYHRSGAAYLFNPNIDAWGCLITKVIPMDGILWTNARLFGLCYDSDEDEYKGLICDITSSPEPIVVVVLQFKKGNWNIKTQPGLPQLNSPTITNIGTIVKGVPYWICKSRMEQLILKFDSKTEELRIVPHLPGDKSVEQLGTLDGQLTGTVSCDEGVEIWTFNECAGGNCVGWTPLFVLPIRIFCLSTLSWMIKDVEILILVNDSMLLVYNVMEGRQRLLSLTLQGNIKHYHDIVVTYIPSSIDPSLNSSYFEGSYGPVAKASTPETWREAGAGAGHPGAVAALSNEVDQRLLSYTPFTLPWRPGFGKIGQPCIVRANHFSVQLTTTTDIYHYDVSISAETSSKESASKEITSKKLCKRIMSELTRLYRKSHLGKRVPAYDGKKGLYTAGPLPFQSSQLVVSLVDEEQCAQRRERKFRVVIKEASIIGSHLLHEFLSGRPTGNPQDAIQALDVVMRAAAPMHYVAIGRSFFSTTLGRDELGEDLESWKGYYQSIRPVQMGLCLNVDVSARPFYKPVFLTEFVTEFLRRRDLSKQLTYQDHLKVKRALRGVRVKTFYLRYTKCHMINSLSVERADQLMFTDDSGPLSVCQYFLKKYGIELQYPFLPCINAGTDNKPVYIPMELCKLVEEQRYLKKLSRDQVAKMLKATCQRPPDRERSIIKMVRDNRYNKSQLVAKEFGIQVSDHELTLINARILPVPKLIYSMGPLVTPELFTPELGQWRMNDKKFYMPANLNNWTCLNFSNLSLVDVEHFCRDLVNMCVSKGMGVSPKPVVPIRAASPAQIDSDLREVHMKARKKLELLKGHMKARKELELLIVILPSSEGAYETIKRICETELGIISQCCDLGKDIKNMRQYLENLSYKINVKAGGINVALEAALGRQIPLLTDEPTIIFGADVSHAKPDDSTPSVAAVVASMDWPGVSKYRALISAQGVREEIIQDQEIRYGYSGGMIRELLVAFYESNGGKKPSRIIFYRDGVSEGQFAQVLLHEVVAIRKACQSLEDGYAPRLTFVVVQKRHHTRLFPNDPNMMDRSGNILPGTVVDTAICHPVQYDFYLSSHAGIQGTSRPTHYHVLLDENYFPADLLQLLTYSLCYTYARCTRSVSIVPPVYYAHLAAFRARAYIIGGTSDIGSTFTSSGKSRRTDKSTEAHPLPKMIDSVKEVMFYC